MCAVMLTSFMNDEGTKTVLNDEKSKDSLLETLLTSIKQCQTRFGGKAELATESNKEVNHLCCVWESIFLHGLKRNAQTTKFSSLLSPSPTLPHSVLWCYIKKHLLNKHEHQRFTLLRNISTDYGRVKAWIRACLNEHSLEKYILLLLENEPSLIQLYESWALIRDAEKSAMMPNCAAGLKSILFALSVDNSMWDEIPPKQILNVEEQHIDLSKSSQVVKVKKKKKVNVVPLNEEMDGSSFSSSGRSSPSSTLSLVISSQACKKSNHNRSSSLDLNRLATKNTSNKLKHHESYEEFFNSYGNNYDSLEGENVITPVSQNGESPSLVPVMQQVEEAATALSNVLNYPTCSNEESIENPGKLNNQDLRQAVVDMMERKDEAEQKVNGLKESLSEEQAKVCSLKDELNTVKGKFEQEMKVLKEENNLLKRQLKKYVSAVQLLRGGASVDQLPVHVPDVTPIPPTLPPINIESEEYEKKLIEVADMHGELMEFNEILQKQINSKDNFIKTLQSELTELRGPLPSTLSNGENIDEYTSVGALVNIWIPCAFLKNPSSPSAHHIYVRIQSDEWNVYRRYTEFYRLKHDTKKSNNEIADLEFPPKKTFGNRQVQFVEERRKSLQKWLRSTLNILLRDRRTTLNKHQLLEIIPFLKSV
ncbi:DgyrCDS12058 [Dimorphilus gyrociliatus]|uniref:DgyrCDS12058 n=1 Tax=Dimorphilus gyrociliatus TaxID=2664684 RepID=A0A7I8W7M6_9ANNE|nr:DgyrCDS12058 [Dimorphilus gyrociliatus]